MPELRSHRLPSCFSSVWVSSQMPVPKFLRVIFEFIAGGAVFAVVGVAVLLGPLWLDHTKETTLPAPTRTFAVGRTTYVWSDAAQVDPVAPQTGNS
jgi:hypothetical protein